MKVLLNSVGLMLRQHLQQLPHDLRSDDPRRLVIYYEIRNGVDELYSVPVLHSSGIHMRILSHQSDAGRHNDQIQRIAGKRQKRGDTQIET